MSNLQAFLHPRYSEKRVSVVVSDRFVDENGEPAKFVLRSRNYETFQALKSRCYKENGTLDEAKFAGYCIAESCVEPDFHNAELCSHYGCIDPASVPLKMLSLGEINILMDAFRKLNDIDGDIASIGEITKN